VLVQEETLTSDSIPPWCNDVVQDVLVLVQEGNLACAIFPPWRDDVVRDELVFAH